MWNCWYDRKEKKAITLKYPPTPPMPGISYISQNMKFAGEILGEHVYSKEQCLDKIRIAETYLAIAKEKLEKL